MLFTKRARRVVVHVKDGPSIEGLRVSRVRSDPLVLHVPKVRETEDRTIPVECEHVEIRASRILFLEVHR